MKIKAEHLQHLKTEIEPILLKYDRLIEEYETGQFSRSEKVQDLQKRFCFDLLQGAGLSRWVSDNLYPYMNDSHLYTALKAVCPTIEKRF